MAYFGEKTLQTNRWFLISTNTKVYVVNRMEFRHNGTKEGKPNIIFRRWPGSALPRTTKSPLHFIEMYIIMLRRNKNGDA